MPKEKSEETRDLTTLASQPIEATNRYKEFLIETPFIFVTKAHQGTFASPQSRSLSLVGSAHHTAAYEATRGQKGKTLPTCNKKASYTLRP